ncbi:unnamed protein product, partial [Cladocopium goreaui]
MEVEICLLLDYFGGSSGRLQPRRIMAAEAVVRGGENPRQGQLMNAFKTHMVAEIFWDFDPEDSSLKPGALQRLLELMALDAATSSDFLEISHLARVILSKRTVDVALDAERLEEFQRAGLDFEDVKELQIFQTLADCVCIFDFLKSQGFHGSECMELFRQRLRVVRELLEEDRSDPWLFEDLAKHGFI